MGMRALAVDAEAVERRGVGRREIAIRAAARKSVDEIEADLTLLKWMVGAVLALNVAMLARMILA